MDEKEFERRSRLHHSDPNHFCMNMRAGFNCSCEFADLHPGPYTFACCYCGIYTASEARCRECTNEGDNHVY